MPQNTAGQRREPPPEGPIQRAAQGMMLLSTLLFVISALAVSSAILVYTAWRHDLKNGVFALIFAVMSAQIAINWLRWRKEEGEPG